MIPNEIIHYKKPAELEPYHVIVVDASVIVHKGNTIAVQLNPTVFL